MTLSNAGSGVCASAPRSPEDTGVFGASTRPAHTKPNALDDGSKCAGFTGGIPPGHPAAVSASCDGQADQVLETDPLEKGLPVSATLDGETVSVTLK